MHKLTAIFFLLVFVCAPIAARAEGIYKWVDEAGNEHYGTKPPTVAKSVSKISGNSFSRYSSSKALNPYQKYKELSESRAQLARPLTLDRGSDKLQIDSNKIGDSFDMNGIEVEDLTKDKIDDEEGLVEETTEGEE